MQCSAGAKQSSTGLIKGKPKEFREKGKMSRSSSRTSLGNGVSVSTPRGSHRGKNPKSLSAAEQRQEQPSSGCEHGCRQSVSPFPCLGDSSRCQPLTVTPSTALPRPSAPPTRGRHSRTQWGQLWHQDGGQCHVHPPSLQPPPRPGATWGQPGGTWSHLGPPGASLGPALQKAAWKEEDGRWTGGRVDLWHLGGHEQDVTSCGRLGESLS